MPQTIEEVVVEVPETTQRSDNIRASWNFSLDKIRQSTQHFSADEQDALVSLFLWCTDDRHPVWRTDAAVSLECSSNLIYQLLTGCYRNPDKSLKRPNPELIKRVRAFLAEELRKYDAVETDFVETPTAKKIFQACELAMESRKPVVLWGPSQIGKTHGLRRFRHKNNHGKTAMAEFMAACGLGGMLRTWADSIGVSSETCTANLIDRIPNALDSQMFMILDEVHLLKHTYQKSSFFKCIEVIRRVWDKRRFPLLMSWTSLKDLENSSHDELVQIWRRATHKIALPKMPTRADIEAFSNHHGLELPSKDLVYDFPVKNGKSIEEKPYEVLRMLAKRDGLEAICERFRYGKKLAAKDKGARFSWYYFTDAHLKIEKNAIQDEKCGWGDDEKGGAK